MPETLASEKNPLLKEVRRAVARGTLTDGGFAVAEGFHLLEEAIRSGREIAAVIASASVKEELLGQAPKSARVVLVSEPIFRTLTSMEAPQGIISLVRPASWTKEDLFGHIPLIVAIDGIQEPGNAGAIVRAAEAFRATGVAFLKGSADPYNPKALRASAGSIFRLPVISGMDAGAFAAELEGKGVRMYAALPQAERNFSGLDLSAPCALAIGGEGRGVSETLRRAGVGARIPTRGVESLNAAVAAGVILYEACRQRAKCHEPV
ncbi:MAG TPA: RNA methyltransferase [Bryobacteraceae bacterium]|nr:RNA methyltransferase [Bryobacteraceae bacterium]